MPLVPGVAVTVKVPVPTPDPGETVMFVLLETAVHPGAIPLVNPTVMDCGLVANEPLKPKFNVLVLRTTDPAPLGLMTVESFAATTAEPPPDTKALFTRGELAF